MCGIFAYINHDVPRCRKDILATLVNGLKRLEYRGYDSAGLACDGGDGGTVTIKRSGKVKNLENAIAAANLDLEALVARHTGMAHTRWATHGPPNEVNCHPHMSNSKMEFTVVHNGIITNSKALRALLERKSYFFVSETDTEAVAVLIQYIFDQQQIHSETKPDFISLVEETVSQLEGSFALVFKSCHFPNQLVATRRGSPLLVGIKKFSEEDSIDDRNREHTPASITVVDSEAHITEQRVQRIHSVSDLSIDNSAVEYFYASDASAIIEHTKKIVFLEDGDIISSLDGKMSIVRPKLQGAILTREIKTVEMELQELMKGTFDHFMLKEIYEQPESVMNTLRGRVFEDKVVLGGLKSHITTMKRCRRLLFIACGTSYNSAIAVRQWLEESTELPVIVDVASDFLDRECPVFRDDVCFFISQSGETADTLSAMRYCESRGALIVGITNTVGSSISRESHCGVHVNAGPEIGVASTKAYTSQVLVLVLIGLLMCEDRVSMIERRKNVINALHELPNLIERVLKSAQKIKDEVAKKFLKAENLLILGRGNTFANCLEGALKIKELTYIHAEGILAGELKHGPLALIDENMPIIMMMMQDSSFVKAENALQQVIARKGRPLLICPEGKRPNTGDVQLDTIEVPQSVDCIQSVLSIIPLQLLSYYVAVEKGFDVDCPRNLAKSVTVE